MKQLRLEHVYNTIKTSVMYSVRRLRYYNYYRKFKQCGNRVILSKGGVILRPEHITFGSNIYISSGFRISAYNLTFGNDILIGPNILIECEDHCFDRAGTPMTQYRESKNFGPVTIENDVWIGANVTILKNTRICEGSIIGACSLVNRDIPPYCIAVGIPAKPVRMRFSRSSLQEHLILMKSLYSFNDVVRYFNNSINHKNRNSEYNTSSFQ
ncbi:MAG: acyltransferase [Syntrophobacteraceae bacterium]